VPSTAIKQIAYLPDARELDVTFVGSNRTYTYFGVEPEVHEDFVHAMSKGQFFNARIRDRYEFRLKTASSPKPRSPERGPAREAHRPTRH
jgi:hypothetical protein